MGFPSICYCIILPKPLVILVHFIDYIKLVLSMAFVYLGLCSPFEDQAFSLTQLDFSSLPSLSTGSPSSIKQRLLAVEFASLISKGLPAGEEAECAVCLGGLEAKHEVRELGNCYHAFHKGCIDKWVDMGQVTCPLCRANLLSKGKEERSLTSYS